MTGAAFSVTVPEDKTPQALSAFVKFLAIAALVQALFWLAINPVINAKPMFTGVIRFSELEVASLPAPTPEAIAAARPIKVESPWSDCCTGGYRLARYTVNLGKVPPRGLLAVNPGMADNWQVYVNGQFLLGDGRMDRNNPTFDGNANVPFTIPAAMLHTGANRIDAVLMRSAMPWFDAGQFAVGDPDIVQADFAHRAFQLNEFTMVNIGTGIALAVLAVVLAFRANTHGLAGWMAVLLVSTVLYAIFYHWYDVPFTPRGRLIYNFALINMQPVAWLGFLSAWTGGGWPGLRRVAAVLLLAVMGWITWLIYLGGDSGFDRASDLSNWFDLAVTSAAIGVFLHAILRYGARRREWEAAILLLCVTLLGYSIITELLWDQASKLMDTSLVLFLLAFAVAYVGRNVRLFQSMGQIADLLQTQLNARTAELEAAHAREKAMVRETAHQQERQRIMRDMHDGLGSQLMSMLLMAKRGKAEPQVMADGLQTVIDEMRLMIDSMDSVGESLQSALTILRERLQSRFESAGQVLVWQQDAALALPDYGPRAVLQVLRVLQEAATNALKHSTGDRITITVEPPTSPPFALRLSVADNGRGMGPDNVRGRGRANMEGRARAIGAQLSLIDSPQGVQVVLDLPNREPVDAP